MVKRSKSNKQSICSKCKSSSITILSEGEVICNNKECLYLDVRNKKGMTKDE